MREAELKHGRIAMLATLGYVAVDLGLRFPGEEYAAVPSALAAHNFGVAKGDMYILLLGVVIFEVISLFATMEMLNGGDRQPGSFNFDPLNLGKDAAKREKFEVNELKNVVACAPRPMAWDTAHSACTPARLPHGAFHVAGALGDGGVRR